MSLGVLAVSSQAAASAVTFTVNPIAAGGTGTTASWNNGLGVNSAGTVTFSAAPLTGVAIGTVTPSGTGVYTATINSTKAAPSVTITASDGVLSGTGSLVVNPGPPASISTPILSPSSIAANGIAQSTATVTVADANSNPVTTDTVTFAASPSTGVTVGTTTNHANGTYSALISGTVAGTPSITATDGTLTSPAATLTLTTPTSPPVNTSPPTISGTPPVQGHVLTALPGTWTGMPAPTFTYQWQRCNSGGSGCANIPGVGATAATYTPVALDLGSTLKVVVTGHNSAGTGVGTSAATAVVTGAPVNTVLPTITGSPLQGQTLTAGNGTWSGFPTPTFTYQWQHCDGGGANCVAIAGATGSTYTLTVADLGSRINVVVSATNSAGSAAASSLATAVVTGAPVNTSLPTISGATVAGQTLTATAGTWTGFPGPTFAYQWRDCNAAGTVCVAIAGATGSTYTLTAADVGSAVDVVVTATNSGGSVAAASSASALVTLTFYSSATTLAVTPTSAVTNQAVTLAATVTVTGNTATGTVTFENAGTPITGCSSVAIASSTLSGTTSCQVAFAALTSPEHLTAVYTPAPATSVSGSTSSAVTLAVGSDTTTIVLTVSSSTVNTGVNVTYTATVTPGHAGPTEPTGTVDFFDGTTPIASCTTQPLTQGATSSTATCTSKYQVGRKHSISAHYRPTRNFAASTSAPVTLTVKSVGPPPIVATTMRWTFLHTPTYTSVLALVVNRAPAGGSLVITCTGRGCPYKKRVIKVAKLKTCKPKPKHRCNTQLARTLDLTPSFRHSRLAPGTRLIIEAVKKGWVGKYYNFTVTPKLPVIRIDCLAPGAKRPGVGCVAR